MKTAILSLLMCVFSMTAEASLEFQMKNIVGTWTGGEYNEIYKIRQQTDNSILVLVLRSGLNEIPLTVAVYHELTDYHSDGFTGSYYGYPKESFYQVSKDLKTMVMIRNFRGSLTKGRNAITILERISDFE